MLSLLEAVDQAADLAQCVGKHREAKESMSIPVECKTLWFQVDLPALPRGVSWTQDIAWMMLSKSLFRMEETVGEHLLNANTFPGMWFYLNAQVTDRVRDSFRSLADADRQSRQLLSLTVPIDLPVWVIDNKHKAHWDHSHLDYTQRRTFTWVSPDASDLVLVRDLTIASVSFEVSIKLLSKSNGDFFESWSRTLKHCLELKDSHS